MTEPGGYVLGHAEAELNRLATQAVLIDPITRRFFRAAGIAEGMRVLDVGSGAGHTAMLLAEIVGPSGEVVGVDRAAVAVQTAERRVAAAGLANVSFRHGDPSQMRLDGGFDAVAGRYVLMFVPAAADMLRDLLRHLRPGGRIVFHEPDWNGTRSSPPVPAFEQVCGWIGRPCSLRAPATTSGRISPRSSPEPASPRRPWRSRPPSVPVRQPAPSCG